MTDHQQMAAAEVDLGEGVQVAPTFDQRVCND
jgi:hypothetical protein